MDMIQGIKERRSIRRFKDMPVPRETLEEIVEAASYAPSWKIILLTEKNCWIRLRRRSV